MDSVCMATCGTTMMMETDWMYMMENNAFSRMSIDLKTQNGRFNVFTLKLEYGQSAYW